MRNCPRCLNTAVIEDGYCGHCRENTMQEIAPGMPKLVKLPDVDELPKDVARKIDAISAHDWRDDDWHDLLRLQRIVRHNLATRHGLLKSSN